jgi:hypothetical protein
MVVAYELAIQGDYLDAYRNDFTTVQSGRMEKQELVQKIADNNYEHGTIKKNGQTVSAKDEYGGQYDEAKRNEN